MSIRSSLARVVNVRGSVLTCSMLTCLLLLAIEVDCSWRSTVESWQKANCCKATLNNFEEVVANART